MAELRCPMCGKNNPDDLEVCQFCGARLKPLLGKDQAAPIRPGEEPKRKDTSELDKAKLSGAEPIRPGQAPTRKSTGELEKALPAWLRSLRGDEAEENPPEGTQDHGSNGGKPTGNTDLLSGLSRAAESNEEEVPSWLAGLRGEASDESTTSAESKEKTEPGFGEVDLLGRLGSEPEKPPEIPAPAEEPTAQEAPTPEEEISTPDWLKALEPLEPEQPGGTTEEKAEPAASGDVPDWLAQMQQQNAVNAPPFETEGEPPAPGSTEEPASLSNLPDWLNRLQEPGAPEEPKPEIEKGENLPDWLSNLPAGEETKATEGENVPDWLSGMEEKTPQTPPAEAENTSVPDWLAGFEEKPAADGTSTASTPDWLSNPEEKAVPEEQSAEQGEKLPEWLSSLDEKAPAPEAQAEENVPDWLSSMEQQAAAAEAPQEQIPPAAAGEVPDWISKLQVDSAAAQAAETPAASEPGPDWLKAMGAGTPAATPPFTKVEAPESEPEAQDSAFAGETPDWLSGVAPEPEKGTAPAEEETSAPGSLEAAALPSWVQAMRPLESVVNEKGGAPGEEQTTEQSGPLAGLVGALPAGPGLGPLRKPPTYSIKLQLSETHQRYVSFFDKLIADESKARPAKVSRVTSHFWWRLGISIILLLAVLFPFITRIPLSPPTSLYAGDTVLSPSGDLSGAAGLIIESLGANAPVLVAFDYEPALSSEVEAAAAPLVDQLMLKGARLALISTSPTGPALAERFLQAAPLVNSHGYASGEGYINLGYLAGGPTALAAFAADPTVTMPLSVDGKAAWSTNTLQNVANLSGFAAIFVLTDNAERGRDWVEQTSQSRSGTPMVMVVSAQAEPMIRPYFDSGQLRGLVSGILDAKVYEQAYSRPGLANHYWDAYSLGVLAAVVMIFIGALWNAASGARARNKGTEEV